ncbi:MAG TPA: sugar phosphate isomerase/epimerase family protein [Chloroflexota bacterium]|nr:sugar phosphate isomerase/epimerase family protein [Chloroflexota bacterium]
MKLCLSTWSLRSHIGKDFPFHEFPRVARERFGIAAVELCQMHFPPPDSRRLDQLLKVVDETGSRIVNVPVDVGNISQRDQRKRAHDVRLIESWVEVAAYVGAPVARVNTGQQDAPLDLSIAIASYNQLADYAEPRGVKLGLENHGGISADPRNMLALVEGVGMHRFGTLPDFGNFAPEVRYAGLAAIAPHALVVHAKTYDLDASGNVPEFDFARCLRIVREAGYDGYLSIEFEGNGDQYAGVQKTIELIRRVDPAVE